MTIWKAIEHNRSMEAKDSANITATIRQKIHGSGERFWRFEDFREFSQFAVAQALSRLTKKGELTRLSKGIYYRGRETPFGKSLPNPADLQNLISKKIKIFPSGTTAANLLGFSTQNIKSPQISTIATSLPKKLLTSGISVKSRRPKIWETLCDKEAAILELLRDGFSLSELSPEETTKRLLRLLSEDRCFEKLSLVSSTEPPRVRAMLGALGEKAKKDKALLTKLRLSLNPLSRYDFGALASLESAHKWQAKQV